MKPGQARRRLGKVVYFVSPNGLVPAKLLSVSEDGRLAEVLVGDLIKLEMEVRLLIP